MTTEVVEYELTYAIFGGDLALSGRFTTIRMEYLARRTEMDSSDPTQVGLTPRASREAFWKQGAYVEIEQRLSPTVDLVLRADGLYRTGNFPVSPEEDTPLSRRSSVARFTLGGAYAFDRAFRLKLSTELWKFSDRDDEGHDAAVGTHVAFVGTY